MASLLDYYDLFTPNESVPVPIEKQADCVDGFVNNTPVYIKVIAAITCILSVVGSVSIILSYVCYKSLRTKAREVIVHISLMDLMAALANFIGIVIDFNARLYTVDNDNTPTGNVNNLCIAQAAFALFGTLASILWTIAIAIYFYVHIIVEGNKMAQQFVYGFYIVCYGLPLLMTVWFGATGKIGHSPIGGSGWCSLIIEPKIGEKDKITLFFGNSLWIYTSFILIPVICISVIAYLRIEVQREDFAHHSRGVIQRVETKLLSIPLIFILLRVWSEILSIASVHFNITSCGFVIFLLIMGGIGDSGQGFFNALIFCVFNSKVRQSYWSSINKWILRRHKSQGLLRDADSTVNNNNEYGNNNISDTYPC